MIALKILKHLVFYGYYSSLSAKKHIKKEIYTFTETAFITDSTSRAPTRQTAKIKLNGTEDDFQSLFKLWMDYLFRWH